MEILHFHLLIFVVVFLSSAPGVFNLGLPCNSSGTTCSALVSFVPKTTTNLSTIITTFNVTSYENLLGANSWNLSVSKSTTIPKNVMIKVPITCSCSNGSGISKDGPIYTVVKDDTLSIIANEKYGGLLVYQDIVKVNAEITDPNKIYVAQKLQIPLPCSCQSESETKENGSLTSGVLHYSYLVQGGNSLEGIAAEMGSNASELMGLNNITDPTKLVAGQILDVPLKACSSNISKSSGDLNLLVANGTYAITAENCVQCSCGLSDLDLYCAPAPLGASCSSMQCENSNLVIGNLTTQKINNGCNVTECSYSGYVNNKILTTLETSIQPQCPAKHLQLALTTPSTLQAPPPETSSPSISPAMSPNDSPASTVPGLSSPPPSTVPRLSNPPPSPSGSTNSMAKSFSLATMLVLGIHFLIH